MAVWDLSPILEGKSIDALMQELSSKATEFASVRAQLKPGIPADTFLAILKQKEQLARIAGRISAYAELSLTENTADSARTALQARISEACADADNHTLFFSHWFKGLSDEEAQRLIDAAGPYRYPLERAREMRSHTLSEKEEQAITIKDLTGSEALTRLYDLITNGFSYEFEGKKHTQEQIGQYKYSPVREKRVAAYQLVLSRYGKEQAALGEIYQDLVLDWKNEEVKLRKFTSPINARNKANDIPDAAIEALLLVVRKNKDVFSDYFTLKAKVLGLKEFDRFDLYVPYKAEQPKHPYDESVQLVLDTYQAFHPQAAAYAKEVFDKKKVHSEVVPNKRSGAFCYSITHDQPPYVMLNHVGTLNDVFTIAHELGHAIHSLAAQGQTDTTFHSSLPLAETASTFGEMLLSSRLLDIADNEQRIAILLRMLDGQYGSIGRQGYFTLFELEAHKRIAAGATTEELNTVYLDNLKEQFGNAVAVDDVFQHEWKYVPHFYHTPFYCYSYAFGNLLVLALFRMYEKDKAGFPAKYMHMLSLGGSKSPQSILSEMGVDITKEEFWQAGFDIIRSEIEELKKLVG